MTTEQLVSMTSLALDQLVGRQYRQEMDDKGDHLFIIDIPPLGTVLRVGLIGRCQAALHGQRALGVLVDDDEAALAFCARRNQEIRFGRFIFAGDSVLFVYSLIGPAVNLESIDFMLRILRAEDCGPDLAAECGSMSVEDMLALRREEDE